jgi:hypothetical protein
MVLLVATIYHLRWRFGMNPDGVSYIDMALQASAGNLDAWVNAYWSPLFPVILTPLFKIFRPEMNELYPLVHAVQGGLLVLGYFLFRSLARELSPAVDHERSPLERLPSLLGSELLIAFIYIWVHSRIGLQSYVTPDLLGYVLMWGMSWAGVRFTRNGTWRSGITLGFAAGLAGLTKAFYVPYGALGIGLALILGAKRLRGLAVAAVFLAIMSVWWVPLREKYPQFPWGAAGPLNRAWSTQKMGVSFIHWHPEVALGASESGVPTHTTRLLQHEPPIFEFAAPISATYAPWYDPAYWFEGVKVAASPSQRFSRIHEVFRTASRVLFYKEFLFFLILIGSWALFLAGGAKSLFSVGLKRLAQDRGLLWLGLHASGGLGAYMTMGSLPRYWGGLLLLLLLTVLATFCVSSTVSRGVDVAKRVSRFSTAVLFISAFLALRMFPWGVVYHAVKTSSKGTSESIEIARALRSPDGLNLEAGQLIGYIGNSFDAYFMQLAGLRVGAEIPDKVDGPKRLCRATSEQQCRSLELMMGSGMTAVVIDQRVSCADHLVSTCGTRPTLAGRVHSIRHLLSVIRKE